MRKETDYLVFEIRNTLEGTPWFGRPVYEILAESDPSKVSVRPVGESHTLLELLHHMFTWAEFTRMQLEKTPGFEPEAYERAMDWRVLNDKKDDWESGLVLFRQSNERILALLSEKKDDDYLSEQAMERKYNFRFLLHGFIQHNIYHQGQIALLNKIL